MLVIIPADKPNDIVSIIPTDQSNDMLVLIPAAGFFSADKPDDCVFFFSR